MQTSATDAAPTSATPRRWVPPRPARVLAATALVLLTGVGDLAFAECAWWAGDGPRTLAPLHVTGSTAHAVAVGAVLIGLALLALAAGLPRGSGLARGLVTIAMVVRIAVAAISLAALGAHTIGVDLAGSAPGILVLGLLWNRRANGYYLT